MCNIIINAANVKLKRNIDIERVIIGTHNQWFQHKVGKKNFVQKCIIGKCDIS